MVFGVASSMFKWFEFFLGLIIWVRVLWDGFATVILPRTVAPMSRLSGLFYRRTWLLWAAVGRRIPQPRLRLSFLAVYGPLSVMTLLVLWVGLLILAFAMIYHSLRERFQVDHESIGFAALLYMSASTFLTLGVGDITSTDPLARFFVILQTGTGYLFLALIISYMPALEQAYGSREVGNMLIHARAGRPPSAVKFLRRYSGSVGSEILRGNLREAERWMATSLQSHLSHPVLALYRAQRWGETWLTSVATILDATALLIAGGEGVLLEQARITYRMGLRLLKDLTEALNLAANPQRHLRLTNDDLTEVLATLNQSILPLKLGPRGATKLLRLVRRYDRYLTTLSAHLALPLPSWTKPGAERRQNDAPQPLRGLLPENRSTRDESPPVS
jgi:hypothetical protein